MELCGAMQASRGEKSSIVLPSTELCMLQYWPDWQVVPTGDRSIMVFTNLFLIGYEACSTGGNYMPGHYKPGQKPMTEQITGPWDREEKPTILFCYMFMLSKCPLSIYIYTHKFVFFSALITDAFFFFHNG